MRLLVTGGAGFIGSNYVRHVLTTTDDSVTVFDALTYAGNLANLRDLSYYPTHGLPVVITRSSNNFGPYQYPEKIIPLFVTNLLEGRKVPLYGDGLNVRDWCYVEDNCAGIDLVLRQGTVGDIYNI